MTPQELATLPKGTRVLLFMEENVVHDETVRIYDHGTIDVPGTIVHITWEEKDSCGGVTSLIDTKSSLWEAFIRDMEVA